MTFAELGFTDSDLLPTNYPLFGFNASPEYPLGKITLPVRASTRSIDVEFLIVKLPSLYNLIMGRTWLHTMQAMPSTYHQLLRFPTKYGNERIRGSQKSAQACYLIVAAKRPKEVKVNSIKISNRVSLKDIGTIPSKKATEDLDQIKINGSPDRFFMIGISLSNVDRTELVSFLLGNLDLFAWTPHKLLDAEAICEVTYPIWTSNTVVVRKKNGSWCICVDFTDLNKACPKDCFSLSKIDQLVDPTTHHQRMSFLDAYRGYHQITMHLKDQEKAAFLTLRGTYCYKGKAFEWTPECQAALDGLKTYLRSVPLLETPSASDLLILYLAVSDRAVSAVLLKEELEEQRPIYYVSKAMVDAKTQYLPLEKLILALVMAARKLMQYFQAHIIGALTDYPFRSALRNAEASG
ncbi:uncharacterized protein LOC114321259 [Camellia sinensis]|uniref:uncharacterized protein LOC114321259 n=1 Tax=Camellia sinensis TaxID=4442 RepID=UPI00103641BC|nr:uncharacterized protein LOC114321259 [Camellia sinensis]